MKPIRKLRKMVLLKLFQDGTLGDYEGGNLVSLKDEHENFVRIIKIALEMVKSSDQRRYQRVCQHLNWIVDYSLYLGPYSGEFFDVVNASVIDFAFLPERGDELWHGGFYAGLIVHEATHGLIRDRGIRYLKTNRIQIERICTAEENRFYKRLAISHPGLDACFHVHFDPTNWDCYWRSNMLTRSISKFRRMVRSVEK